MAQKGVPRRLEWAIQWLWFSKSAPSPWEQQSQTHNEKANFWQLVENQRGLLVENQKLGVCRTQSCFWVHMPQSKWDGQAHSPQHDPGKAIVIEWHRHLSHYNSGQVSWIDPQNASHLWTDMIPLLNSTISSSQIQNSPTGLHTTTKSSVIFVYALPCWHLFVYKFKKAGHQWWLQTYASFSETENCWKVGERAVGEANHPCRKTVKKTYEL